MWNILGHDNTIAYEKWPEYDEAKTIDTMIEIAVQVNGRLRGTISIDKNIDKDSAISIAKNDERVAEVIVGKTIVKEIYVPGKIVNIVVK
jgi:leucyl-tRNA synthetase